MGGANLFALGHREDKENGKGAEISKNAKQCRPLVHTGFNGWGQWSTFIPHSFSIPFPSLSLLFPFLPLIPFPARCVPPLSFPPQIQLLGLGSAL